MAGREIEENVSFVCEDHNILWCVAIIYQGVVKKQWQKSKKNEKNPDMILHFIQPAKIAYFQVKIKGVKMFDNQQGKKQCYFLMYFPEKKMKTDLKKWRSDRGKSADKLVFFANRGKGKSPRKTLDDSVRDMRIKARERKRANAWNPVQTGSAFGNAARGNFPVTGQISELVVQEASEH